MSADVCRYCGTVLRQDDDVDAAGSANAACVDAHADDRRDAAGRADADGTVPARLVGRWSPLMALRTIALV